MKILRHHPDCRPRSPRCARAAAAVPPPQSNPHHGAAHGGRLHRPGAVHGRRAVVQASTSGTTSRRTTAAAAATTPRARRRSFARNDDVNLAYADANTIVNLTQPDQSQHGAEGRGRPQLLAVEQCRLRRHPHHLDPQLGGLGSRRRHADHSCRRRTTWTWASSKTFPDRHDAALSASSDRLAAGARRRQLRALPFADRGHAAVAVLRQRRRRRGLCRRARQDRSGHAGQFALRGAAGR